MTDHRKGCGVNKCLECGEMYHRDSGPMITVCTPCLMKPRPPDRFIEQGRILVPNPERVRWDEEQSANKRDGF